MATTGFTPWAIGSGADTYTSSAFLAMTSLIQNGFQVGVADAAAMNTILRQTAIMSAAWATWLVGQGINVPDDGNLSNLVTEITEGLTAFQSTLYPSTIASGYQRTVGGLIEQTGMGYVNAGSSIAFTFPITFPNQCKSVVFTPQFSSGNQYELGEVSYSNSQVTVFNPNPTGLDITYIADGY